MTTQHRTNMIENLSWQIYQPEVMTQISTNQVVIRLAKTVSDILPKTTKLFGDRMLELVGYYNKRGYCIGYSLEFKNNPIVTLRDFYVVVDYVKSGKNPKSPSFPKLPKKDSKICFVKFGDLLDHRMYTFIYRKKRDG